MYHPRFSLTTRHIKVLQLLHRASCSSYPSDEQEFGKEAIYLAKGLHFVRILGYNISTDAERLS